MKRMTCILLILALLLPLTACTQKQEIQRPATFYYCRKNPVYGAEDGLIAGETRETAGYEDNFLGLINRYVSGPDSPELIRPFPFAALATDCSVGDQSVFLVFSDTLSVLKGVDLTLAVACLTMTVYELTGIDTIHVKTESKKLDGLEVVTMRVQDIFLLDSSELPADPE